MRCGTFIFCFATRHVVIASPSESIGQTLNILISNTTHIIKGKFTVKKGISLLIRHLRMLAVALDYTS